MKTDVTTVNHRRLRSEETAAAERLIERQGFTDEDRETIRTMLGLIEPKQAVPHCAIHNRPRVHHPGNTWRCMVCETEARKRAWVARKANAQAAS